MECFGKKYKVIFECGECKISNSCNKEYGKYKERIMEDKRELVIKIITKDEKLYSLLSTRKPAVKIELEELNEGVK